MQFVILLQLVFYFGLITYTDSSPWRRQREGECDKSLSCLPIADCSLTPKEYETAFPCNGFDSPDLKVCCQGPTAKLENKDGITPSPTTPSSTLKTTSRPSSKAPTTPASSSNTTSRPSSKAPTTKMTTPKPKSTTPYVPFTLDNLWDDVPETLREKVSLLPEDCGRVLVSNRILNGEDAALGEYPWMALLGYEDPVTQKPVWFCGGTLINKRYILTAAHCSKAGNFTPTIVRLGEWNIDTEKDCAKLSDGSEECSDPVVDVPVETFIKHELYGNRSYPLLRFDIALIRMAKDVNITSDYVCPICLSSKLHRDPRQKYAVSGWGVTENESWKPSTVLQRVDVALFDFNECNAAAPAEVSPLSRSAQFCAGGLSGQDACRGDSGGPLSYTFYNREFQKGVVSLATSQTCGREGKPTVYTEVTNFIKWILTTIKP